MSGRSFRLATCAALAAAVALAASAATAAPRKKPPKPKPAPTKPDATKPDASAPTPRTDAPAPEPGAAVQISVVDVAGELAYFKPGTSAGIHRGSYVVIRGERYKVIGATATYAVIQASASGPRIGDRGTAATTKEEEEEATHALAPPRPLAEFARAWPEPVAPAATQQPKPVPLGGAERGGRIRVLLSSTGMAFIPLDDRTTGIARGELRARVHAEPFSAPIAFDADAAVQGYASPELSSHPGSRPLLLVRELLLGVGRPRGFGASVGRMRYAASTLGTLDGVRAQAPLGAGFSLGAFGGLLPDPVTGNVALDAQRFGVEANYLDLESDLRPEAALVAHASTFKGQLDERRLSALVSLFPGASRVGGHVEVSSFDANNPWKAAPIELSAAGVDGSVRVGPVQLGGRVDLQQQERSRYLAAFLPLSWFCTTQPSATPGAPDECVDGRGSQRLLEAADASLELGQFGLMVGGTAQQTTAGGPNMIGALGSARVVRIARHFRVEASGSFSKGTYMDLYGASAGPGVSLFGDTLDASAYYREARLTYRANRDVLAQHAVGAMFVILPASELVLTLQGEGQTGDDAKALVALMNLLWRPRL